MNEENKEQVVEGEVEKERDAQPEDLAEAMSALRENNGQDSKGEVAGVSDDQPSGSDGSAPSDAADKDTQPEPDTGQDSSIPADATVQAADEATYDVRGGSTVVGTPDDYASARQNLLDSISRQAQMDTTAEFQKNDIQKINVNRLYQQDPETGRVSFINPDDVRSDGRGNQTFGEFASRAEAQAWCNAFNEQIDQQYRQTIAEKQNEYLDQMMPAVRLLDFAPTYNKLSKDVQKTMDTLIEPYGVYDAENHLIGFNCDLDAAAKQATTIANQYRGRASQTNAAKQSSVAAPKSGPATDAKTRSSASSGKDVEPKNLEEAMKQLKDQNAARRTQEKKGKR